MLLQAYVQAQCTQAVFAFVRREGFRLTDQVSHMSDASAFIAVDPCHDYFASLVSIHSTCGKAGGKQQLVAWIWYSMSTISCRVTNLA